MTSTALARLRSGALAILGRELPESAAVKFDKYLALLSKWQKRHRLVGSIEPMWVVENLFLDSLLFFRVLPPDAREIVDVGSGAGFPGYPLQIARPEVRLTLIESRRMRASFLRAIARELELGDVTILEQRVETTVSAVGRRFDAAVMRCAADPEALFPETEGLVIDDGLLIAAGGPTARRTRGINRVDVPGTDPGITRAFLVKRCLRGPQQ